jgi:probable phosphoglycerate mutase
MLYVMRHAQSIVNVQQIFTCRRMDGELTALGREQAQQAAVWLEARGIEAIYASPFERTQESAQIIGAHLGILTITTLDGLREIDCGTALEWQPLDDATRSMWRRIFEFWLRGEWHARYEGGESGHEAHARYRGALQLAEQGGANVLVVTHGGITRGMLPFLLTNRQQLEPFSNIDNTAFMLLKDYHAEAQQWHCQGWNVTDHLSR